MRDQRRKRSQHPLPASTEGALTHTQPTLDIAEVHQRDEWLVGRRYLSNHSLDALLNPEKEGEADKEETRELTAA